MRLIDKIKQDCDPLRDFSICRAQRARILRRACASVFLATMPSTTLHNEHELVIVRVLHGARDAAALAEHGGFAEG